MFCRRLHPANPKRSAHKRSYRIWVFIAGFLACLLKRALVGCLAMVHPLSVTPGTSVSSEFGKTIGICVTA
jgi:hypothetical protein